MKQALEDYVQEWKDFGIDEEIRLGYVAVTRARHLLLCSGSWWRDGKTVCGPVVAAARPSGPPARTAPATVVHWAEAPADDATNPALEEWPVGQLAGRPADRRDAAARSPPPPIWSTPPRRIRSTPERVLDGADPLVEQWVRDADLLLRERARHGQPDRRRPAALAPVGVGAGHPAPRPGRAGPAAAPSRCRPPRRRRPGAAPRSTPGWRSGSARRSWSTSTSCPAPATSSPPPTARWPSCRRPSWPASGPTGSRPRSRCRSRRRWAR